MAAKRLLLGWNNPHQKVQDLAAKGIQVTPFELFDFITLEQQIEDDFIVKMKEELELGNIRVGEEWENRINKLKIGVLETTTQNQEKLNHLEQLREILPKDVMERIKNHCIQVHLEAINNRDLLNKLIP